MYPRNNATPPTIDVGALVQISDGAVQTSGESARVKIGTGSWGAAAGTAACDATSGIYTYTPSQSETNAEFFIVAIYKTGCIPISRTVITSQSATAGQVRLEGVTHTSAVVPTVTTTTTATNVTTVSAGGISAASFAADVDAEILSYLVDDATKIDASALNTASGTTIPAILDDTGTAGVVVALGSKTGYSLTATTGLGNQTANITGNLTGSVGSVTGAVGSVTGAVGSVTGNVGGNVTGSVGSISGVTFPSNFAALGINASGHVSRVVLVDTTTTNSDMRGTDSAALAATALSTATWTGTLATNLGTTNSDLANGGRLDLLIDAIKAKTDSMTFTVAGFIDSNLQYVNDIQVIGEGVPTTDPWRPV